MNKKNQNFRKKYIHADMAIEKYFITKEELFRGIVEARFDDLKITTEFELLFREKQIKRDYNAKDGSSASTQVLVAVGSGIATTAALTSIQKVTKTIRLKRFLKAALALILGVSKKNKKG